ncbi:MAG: class I SAM-dependent methyltransferase [archaeon]
MTSDINQNKLSTQYDEIGKEYLSAREAFYQNVADGAKLFIDSQLTRVKPTRGRFLLDIGCGDCSDTEKYKKLGFKTFGLDSSRVMLDKAIEKGFDPEHLIHSSMDNIPASEKSFDVLTSRYALHYLENLDPAFEEFARIIKPEGLLVFIVGHPLNNLLRQQNKVYGEKEVIEVPLYGDKTTVKSVSHTFSDYISPTFLNNFDLLHLEEGKQKNEKEIEGFQTPGFLGFVGRKR